LGRRGSRAPGRESGWDDDEERATFGSGRPTRDQGGSSLRSLDVSGLVDKLRAPKGGRFKPGEKVRHPTFGVGIVTKSLGAGEDEQVSVVFPGHGEKRLLLAYTKLEKV
jgi:hypothetical protein